MLIQIISCKNLRETKMMKPFLSKYFNLKNKIFCLQIIYLLYLYVCL